jgi:type II secretory pathway component PulF
MSVKIKMMKLSDIESASAALGNQIQAGINLHDAVSRMVKLQKKNAEQWNMVADGIGNGQKLSKLLEGLWPDSLVSSIRAGEMSGNLPEVLHKIEETLVLQQKIRGTMMQLAYPAVLSSAGLGVFIFFMVKVLPQLAKSLDMKDDKSFVFLLSEWMSVAFNDYWYVIVSVLTAIIWGAVAWLKVADNREKLIEMTSNVPLAGEAFRNIYFGLWAHYLVILDSAGGIPIKEKLLLSCTVMPMAFQRGVYMMADEVERRGIPNSVDPDKQEPGDPRISWPFYIPTAFIVANETGRLDVEMQRVAPAMLKDGFRMIDRLFKVANLVALAVSGFLITSPLMAYYAQLGKALTHAINS